jgi:hypothetical protein
MDMSYLKQGKDIRSHYPRASGKTWKMVSELDKELERAQAWVSSAENKYARLDKKRIREFAAGSITEETTEAYKEAVANLDKACSVHAALLEKRKQIRKENKSPYRA